MYKERAIQSHKADNIRSGVIHTYVDIALIQIDYEN